jgi:hypothetical protein
MTFKVLSVHVDARPSAADRIEAAASLARRFGAPLIGLFAATNIEGSDKAVGGRRQRLLDAAEVGEQRFRETCADAGIEGVWHRAIVATAAEVATVVVVAARHSDLVVIGQHDPDADDGSLPERLVETVIGRSGRPVLIIPYTGQYTTLGQRAVVAWNGSRESARAVADALPLLAQASRVVIATVNPGVLETSLLSGPLADLCAYLARHGIVASTDRVPIADRDIGPVETLLSYLTDISADLLIIGGVADSDRERRPRSLTADLLRQMTVPLLVSY